MKSTITDEIMFWLEMTNVEVAKKVKQADGLFKNKSTKVRGVFEFDGDEYLIVEKDKILTSGFIIKSDKLVFKFNIRIDKELREDILRRQFITDADLDKFVIPMRYRLQ